MSCMKWLTVVVILAGFPLHSAEAEENALSQQCKDLQSISKESFPPDRQYEAGSFWSNPAVRNTYVQAIQGDLSTVQGLSLVKPMDDTRKASVLLAAIARRDLPLMKQSVSSGSLNYLGTHNPYAPVTLSAICNFSEGVRLLVTKGVNVNIGDDLGAFNASLLYENLDLTNYLLSHGYNISANSKRCKSSKYILNRHAVKISPVIASKIEQAICAESENKS